MGELDKRHAVRSQNTCVQSTNFAIHQWMCKADPGTCCFPKRTTKCICPRCSKVVSSPANIRHWLRLETPKVIELDVMLQRESCVLRREGGVYDIKHSKVANLHFKFLHSQQFELL